MAGTVPINPKSIGWKDPTLNEDQSAIASTPGEVITGYQGGIRATGATGSAAGTYPFMLPPVMSPTAVSELFSSLVPTLAPAGDDTTPGYMVAFKTLSKFNGVESDSPWSAEVGFSIAPPPPPVPQPPSSLTVA